MSKLLTYGATLAGAVLLAYFGTAMYFSGWDLSKASTMLAGYFTSMIGTVSNTLQGVLSNFISMFQSDPATALSYVAAGATPAIAVGGLAYRWITGRKNKEINKMNEQHLRDWNKVHDDFNDQRTLITDQKQQIEDLQSQLAGNLDVTEIQKQLVAARAEITRDRLQVDNLHEVIKNLKSETIIEKTIIK